MTTMCYTPAGMKPNLDHLSAVLCQVCVVVTTTRTPIARTMKSAQFEGTSFGVLMNMSLLGQAGLTNRDLLLSAYPHSAFQVSKTCSLNNVEFDRP